MLQEIIDLQNEAIMEIISQLKKTEKNITFKSPTGSGKTYMMAKVMDEILFQNDDIIFLVSSLSKGNLAEQNYEKFLEYSDEKIFNNILPFLINSESSGEGGIYIPDNYNVYVLPRDLYKKTAKLKKGAYLKKFLEEITKNQKKKVYLIKDECHIATNNLDELSDTYFSKILSCSATPKKNQKPDVQISNIDAVNAKLIKKVEYDTEDSEINNVLDKFKEIKKKYEKAIQDKEFGQAINPCLIIQISNKDKADEEIEEIRTTLNKTKYQDLQWMLIVDKDRECVSNNIIQKLPVSKWKNEAKKNESTIDIIIFKMVITEGWDIPRACMLFQPRNSRSKQLDEQVVGRIRRNPKLKNFEKLSQENQELVTTAYVWGIENEDKKETVEVKLVGNNNKKEENEIQKEFRIKTTRLKRLEEIKETEILPFLDNLIKSSDSPLLPETIFKLYNKYKNIPNEVKEICNSCIKDYSSWFKISNNIDKIIKKTKDISCNYSENMKITTDENDNELEFTLPIISSYTDNGNYEKINDWIWQRKDNKDSFSFDSESEKEWFKILTNLYIKKSQNKIKNILIKNLFNQDGEKKYLIGKNYLLNSDIKYEYYLYGIHSSYPDFIMKDSDNRIHLFESKSLNKSKNNFLDHQEYEEKAKALKECYKFSSKLTGYYFYIPIKRNNEWTIYQYFNGEEKILDKNTFLSFFD